MFDNHGEWLSDKQIAAELGVHRVTVWRWTRTQEFPEPIKLSERCTRWRVADVIDWLKKRMGKK